MLIKNEKGEIIVNYNQDEIENINRHIHYKANEMRLNSYRGPEIDLNKLSNIKEIYYNEASKYLLPDIVKYILMDYTEGPVYQCFICCNIYFDKMDGHYDGYCSDKCEYEDFKMKYKIQFETSKSMFLNKFKFAKDKGKYRAQNNHIFKFYGLPHYKE